MALENLEPVTRMESILNGDEISPVTREEYFWQKAATSGSGGLPEYTAADVGKVLMLGEDAEHSTVAPVWGRGPVNIIALSNRAVMDLQSTLASTLTSMLSGNKDSIVSVDTDFSTNDDKEAVLAIIENGINGVISAFDFFGSKLIIPSYTVGENEGSLVLSIPFYTSVVGSTEYYLRITVKITASLPGKLDKFTHTIAVEKIDFHTK